MSGLTKRGVQGAADALEVNALLRQLNATLAGLNTRITALENKPDYALPLITLGGLDPSVMSAVGGVANAAGISALGSANATTAAGLSLKEDKANKDRARGYPSLDANRTVPVAEIPDLSELYAEALLWDYARAMERRLNLIEAEMGIVHQEVSYENGI